MMAPKRPLSPFIFFSQEARRKLKKENPDMLFHQIATIEAEFNTDKLKIDMEYIAVKFQILHFCFMFKQYNKIPKRLESESRARK